MKSYFFIGFFLFSLLNLSKDQMDPLRSRVIASLAPMWGSLQSKEPNQLEGNGQIAKATVVFRDPSQWNGCIWIGLGEKNNRTEQRVLIAKNSPVLSRNSLIGVVEYVGESQSRVRLITDAGLVPAVRAVRGGMQNREVLYHVELLFEHLGARPDLFSSTTEQEQVLQGMHLLKSRLQPCKEELLAKGELHGRSTPLWRSSHPILEGIGFNYDCADDAGPARDLHTGRPISFINSPGVPLLKVGDLLVTSGLDGVFPPGIPVALVTKIAALERGDISYRLEAKPTAGDLIDLHTVFVLPPI